MGSATADGHAEQNTTAMLKASSDLQMGMPSKTLWQCSRHHQICKGAARKGRHVQEPCLCCTPAPQMQSHWCSPTGPAPSRLTLPPPMLHAPCHGPRQTRCPSNRQCGGPQAQRQSAWQSSAWCNSSAVVKHVRGKPTSHFDRCRPGAYKQTQTCLQQAPAYNILQAAHPADRHTTRACVRPHGSNMDGTRMMSQAA